MVDVSKEVRVAFEGDDRISETILGINKNVQIKVSQESQ